MKILERYIAKTVLSSIGLVTLILAGLQIFILFVNLLDDIGRGDFGILQCTQYVLLQMPYQVYLFFPMASLLGSLIGLGVLANNRELIVMRAAGVSIGRITFAVLEAAIVVILIVTATGETIVPKLAQIGNDIRMQAISRGQTLRTAQGIWLRDHNDFINITTVHSNNTLENVFQFRFDDANKLQFSRQIAKITLDHGTWIAKNIAQTLLGDHTIKAEKIENMVWDVGVNPAILSASSREPDEMTLLELKRYLRAKKRSHQTAAVYQLAYWQRIVQPLTTIVMMILAIPFIFGPLRSSTMGAKLLAGATVGFGFHIVNKFLGPVSQVFQWPPLLPALGPTLMFALLGFYLMKRVR